MANCFYKTSRSKHKFTNSLLVTVEVQVTTKAILRKAIYFLLLLSYLIIKLKVCMLFASKYLGEGAGLVPSALPPSTSTVLVDHPSVKKKLLSECPFKFEELIFQVLLNQGHFLSIDKLFFKKLRKSFK